VCLIKLFIAFVLALHGGNFGADKVQISDAGIDAIKHRECRPPDFDYVLVAYDDGYGNITAGCGHVAPELKAGERIMPE